MIGAIAGDVIGSPYEFRKIPEEGFRLFTKNSKFTDDTVLTVALADTILNNKDWIDTLHAYFSMYENGGFGGYFKKWCREKQREPYNSFGNGSAMRVSPVAWAYNTLPRVLSEAKISADATHNHPEGVKGAQATAAAIFLARTTKSKELIRYYINTHFYNLEITTVDKTREYISGLKNRAPACSCEWTVPPAINAFLDTDTFVDSIRMAISIGGDTDTLACITGSIAEAYYGTIPKRLGEAVWRRLNPHLRKITINFYKAYIQKNK